MRITVLGSGTSGGVPAIGCDCPVCRSDKPENKRLRSSIRVEHNRTSLLVDCSIDFRQQALTHDIRRVDAVILTHDHADHIGGINELRVYNFMQGRPIRIFGKADALATLRRNYDYCFNPVQVGGGVPELELIEIESDRTFEIDGIHIAPIPILHGKLKILGYRIGSEFAYLTDCSHVPDSSLPLLDGVRVLILDALRYTPHPTHFSLPQAVEFAQTVGAEETWFTHIACKMEHFEANASLPDNMNLLHDGQVIEVEP